MMIEIFVAGLKPAVACLLKAQLGIVVIMTRKRRFNI